MNAATSMGSFAVDSVEFVFDELRNTYQSGAMAYNQVTKVIETPCEDKWDVLLETALPAAGSALWLLLVPRPQEMLENYLSPKNMRGAGRGAADAKEARRRKGASGRIRRRWPRIPNPDRLIADRLPGAQAVQGRDVGAGQRWLFQGIDIADRVLWHFLVLDVTQEFFTKWSSGIMESRFCSKPLELIVIAQASTQDPFVNWTTFHESVWNASTVKGIEPPGDFYGEYAGVFDIELTLVLELTASSPYFPGIGLHWDLEVHYEDGTREDIRKRQPDETVDVWKMEWQVKRSKVTRITLDSNYAQSGEVLKSGTYTVFGNESA